MKHAVKFAPGTDDVIEGLGAPYGGVHNGKDLDGEYFSVKTDFALDWFDARPLLYGHGLDEGTEISPVGTIKSWDLKDDGLWVQAQLDKSSAYFGAIQKLVKAGKLFFSSGAMSHLVQKAKSGEITRWPWVEMSLTPTPANLLATLSLADAEKHWKSAGLDIAGLQKEAGPETKAVSYEDLRGQIENALNPRDPFGDRIDDYTCVVATYPDSVIVQRYDYDNDGDGGYFRIAYTVADDGTITLGEPDAVEPSYVPVPDTRRPVVADAVFATRAAATLTARVEALSERRAKSGRQLSPANRAALDRSVEALGGALEQLRAHLASTPEVKAEDLHRRDRDIELLSLWAEVAIPSD